MTSWETCDGNLDDHDGRDFVLKQPSTVGPWLALGLGMTLVAFLGYLVYVNLLFPLPSAGSPESLRRPDATSTARLSRAKHTAQRSPARHQPTVTVVPQGRAANALLGGQGPALPPEHALAPVVSPGLHVPLQTAVGRP